MTKDNRHNPGLITVRVLYTAGCAATPDTIDVIRDAAAEMDLHIRMEKVLVESPEQAVALKFLGSPTVQVNGLDIDPAARQVTTYGFM